MNSNAGQPPRRVADAATRAEFLDLERHCAKRPDDAANRRRLLQLFFALGQPDDLPGSSLVVAGTPTPRIAVLTPYFQESLELLERCHKSVRLQTLPCEHVLVADGFPRAELDSWPVRHIRLPTPSRNFGDTPRRIAGDAAIEAGFDAVAYLDADNWLRPRHIESLFACHLARGTPICHSGRTLHRVDGTLMPIFTRGDNTLHVDTSCLLVTAGAFDLLALWGTWPTELSRIDDRMFWRDKALLEFAYASGVRVSELTTLKLRDLALSEGFASVFGKGSKERLVPVGRAAIQAIQVYLREVRPGLARNGGDGANVGYGHHGVRR